MTRYSSDPWNDPPEDDLWSSSAESGELELGTKPDGSTCAVSVSAFDRHAQVIGTTGGGKTFFLRHLFHQLAARTSSAQVFLDPTGNAYHLLKRWAYSQKLDDRLVLIDPSEQRLICGVNPIAPWRDNHTLQAAMAWETLRRALDAADFAQAPLLEQWMCNTLFALVSTGMTMHEAPDLLKFEDDGFRRTLIERLPDSDARADFGYIDRMIDENPKAAFREWQLQLGSAYRRVLHYARNDYLLRMLGTTQHVVDWDEVLDQRKLVLINLNPAGGGRTVLAPDHVRMLGLQLLSELIQTAFHRTRASGQSSPPCYLFVDEAQHFVSANMERILSEGRQFNLRLILAHRSPAELIDERRDSERLLRLVASCTQLKVVFGGLDRRDTEPLAWTLAGHHLDLKEVKDEIQTWSQLSHIEDVVDTTVSEGSASAYSSSSTYGDTESSSRSEYDDGSQALTRGLGSSHAFSSAMSEVSNWTSAEHHHRQVVPGEPFLQTTGRQFYNLDEQIHKVISRLILQPPQHATLAIGKDVPIEFRVADVVEPSISYKQTLGLDLDLMQALPYYAPPRLIEEEIHERMRALRPPRHRGKKKPTPLLDIHKTRRPDSGSDRP